MDAAMADVYRGMTPPQRLCVRDVAARPPTAGGGRHVALLEWDAAYREVGRRLLNGSG